ncbi:hypothetical protein O9992_03560 [Vibrio lentus]|nr:hypothetical protein [Vibrio lentus]
MSRLAFFGVALASGACLCVENAVGGVNHLLAMKSVLVVLVASRFSACLLRLALIRRLILW